METRRTRIVCISDTHNSTVKLPKGDVLIHAGDLTNQGTETELARTVAWLEKADFECKIVIAGNHDVTLDKAFYAQHGAVFHNQTPQLADQCRTLLEHSTTITYLRHESAEVRLSSPDGPGTTFTVFGSPYSPQVGTWAFSYPPASVPAHSPAAVSPDLATDLRIGDMPWDEAWDNIWTAIPTNTDIVVTHTPALGLCDWSSTRGSNLGCPGLQKALRRVRPQLAVCGHVHEGRGCGRVRWNSPGSSEQGEYFVDLEQWEDPSPGASKKLSIVKLTGRDGVVARGSETCIVNSAITATNYPHVGGKKTNKPIVVDIDLRV